MPAGGLSRTARNTASIVAAVASAHGGRVDLAALAEGGLRVTVRLPAARGPRDEEAAGTAGAVGLPHGTPVATGRQPGTGESGR